jgi:hypothetical protein
MIVTPDNAVDMAYGFTENCLAQYLETNCWSGLYSLANSQPLVFGVSSPEWKGATPQFQFSGYSFVIRNATGSEVLLQLGPGATQATINLAFYGATFTDNSQVPSGGKPIYVEFDNCVPAPPANATIVSMAGAGSLIVSFSATIVQKTPNPVPIALQTSLQTAFGANASKISISGLYASISTPASVSAAMQVPASALPPSVAASIVSAFSAWISTAAPSTVTNWPLIYMGTVATPNASLPMVAQDYAFTVLPAGTTSGGQPAPPSLFVACSLGTPLPTSLSGAVADAGKLFSVNQQTGTSATNPWTGVPSGLFFLASLPFAQGIVNCFEASSAYQALGNGSQIVSESDDNWGLQSATVPINGTIKVTQLSSKDLWGCFGYYNGNYSQTSKGFWSNASITDQIEVSMVMGSIGGPGVGLQMVHNFQGTTSNSTVNSFLTMSQAQPYQVIVSYGLSTSGSPPTAGISLTRLNTTTSAFSPPLTGYSNAVTQANSVFSTIASTFATDIDGLVGLSSLAAITVGDLSFSIATPMIDQSYGLNVPLTIVTG